MWYRILSAIAVAAVVVNSSRQSLGQCSLTLSGELTGEAPAAQNWFGSAVAVSDDTVVVGDYLDNQLGHWAGAVYVFRKSSGAWGMIAKLTASDGMADDRLGRCVAIRGDTLIASSYTAGANGAAYVFRETDGVWREVAKLTAEDGMENDYFGANIDFDGASVIVGARLHEDDESAKGAAYIFREVDGAWRQVAKLVSQDANSGGLFGYDVAIDGDTALVSEFYGGETSSRRGSVTIFRESAGVWAPVTTLSRTTTRNYNLLGYAVAFRGDTAFASVIDEYEIPCIESPCRSGTVYVYREIAGQWHEVAQLKGDNHANVLSENFGMTLDFDGDTLAVGAPTEDEFVADGGGGAYSNGAVYLYREFNGDWLRIGRLSPSNPWNDNKFGLSLAIADGKLVVAKRFIDAGIAGGAAETLEFQTTCEDCNNNGAPDDADIATGAAGDCNHNLVPDTCEIAAGAFPDCNNNGVPDACDFASGTSIDCNSNGVPDECDITAGLAEDCDANGEIDACDAVELTEAARITATTPNSGAQFGMCVSMSGDTAILGAPLDDTIGHSNGAAYVVRRDNGEWRPVAQLMQEAPTGTSNYFGISVSIDDRYAVVGIRECNDAALAAGAVDVFVEDADGVWSRQAHLLAFDATRYERLGASVAIDGDIVVAGAPNADNLADDAGAAIVFRRAGSVWAQIARLTPSDAAAGDHYGGRVAISGDTILVASAASEPNHIYRERVGVFREIAGVWTEVGALTPNDSNLDIGFGLSISLCGSTAVVGAPGFDAPGVDRGAVYVFEESAGDWTLVDRLAPMSGVDGTCFGVSAAIRNDILVIGASNEERDTRRTPGRVYLFRRVDGVWTRIAHMSASDATIDARFGSEIAVDGESIIVGARLSRIDGESTAGAAYLFKYDSPPGDCNANGIADVCESLWTLNDFVHALLNASNETFDICRFDNDGDGVVDGRDVQAFVTRLLAD
ncbi:MAG TPA: hypothetical protein P5081_14300 [Phycisphaerae bacterium]|nr:hypothetical protein [Phycisphaerae bacterium]HRW54041.1 hypothetical protein [Phycisphaerae bacterium]